MKLVVASITFILILNNLNTFVQSIDDSKWNLITFNYRRSIDAAVTQYYERKTFMMSICVNLEYTKLWQNYIMDFLSDALTNSKLMKYEIFMNKNNRLQRITKVSKHNLWYVDSYKAFCSLMTVINNDCSDYVGEYVIIMNTAKSLSKKREVQLILERSFQLNIVNIVVAVYVGDGSFALYSYDIFKQHHCQEVVVEQVNIFHNEKFQNEKLFPYKFNNFNNCPLTMYIRNSSLFFSFNVTQDGRQIDSIEGVEANMIQTMAKKLNFKLHMHYEKQDKSVGNVYENGTAVGPFRFLNEKKLDVLMGYFHNPVRSHYFEESNSYAFMPLVIVISKYKRNDFLEVWLFKPFSPKTWLILGLSFFLVIILVQLAYYYLNKTVTWVDIVGLVLGNSRPLHLKMFMTKVAFLLCILCIMILCATFQGRLYYAFNTEDNFKITTVQQLIKANYTFLITKRFDKDIIRSVHIPLKQILFVDATDDYLIYEKMRSYPINSATFTNYWDFQMYIDSKNCYSEFDMLPLVVLLNHICAYTRRHSYLIEPINRVIDSLNSGGILNKWLQDRTNVHKMKDIYLGTKHNICDKPLPLTLNKFKIVFAGLIFLYFLSILTFLGEFIVRDWAKIVKKLKQFKIKGLKKIFYK